MFLSNLLDLHGTRVPEDSGTSFNRYVGP